METRSRIGKMCVCAVVLLAMVGMMLPPVIGEGGKASPAVAKLNTCSAPESVGEDTNGDGLTDKGEAMLGTYQTNPDTYSKDMDDYKQWFIDKDIPPLDELKGPHDERDTDGDGLTDQEEEKGTFGYKTDPKNPDTDGDGLNDLQEYWWLCDPNKVDTNGDSINDGDSVYNRLTYPYRSDSLTKDNDPDEDGLPTGAERYDTGTDYKAFSTDGDPYGDGQEFFGINMPSISPADHPLVAAYPDLSARLEAIEVTPKETIFISTTGEVKQEQDAWSITTETSDSESFEWGLLEESLKVAWSGSWIPSEEVTVTGHQTWADTHTVTNSTTNSGWTQEDWSRATTTDTVEAAYLKFTMNVKNGGAPAAEITPDVTILMGEKPIATITSPTSINSLDMGETSGDFVVQDITVTLDELMAIDCGATLYIETSQVNAKVTKWDGADWVLTDHSTYMSEINDDSATLMLVLSDGTSKKYKVFAGSSDNYNPGVTLGDAINWTIGSDDRVPQLEENQMWYFGFSANAFDEVREWIAANNNIQNLTLKPSWEIVMRAESTEPEPQIEWAYYSVDMKEVFALVTDDMGIESVIAHVNISDVYTDLTMTDDDGDSIYVATTWTEEMEKDIINARVNATDIEGNTAQALISVRISADPINDTDEDGLNDLEEYWWLCDPNDPDTNGDGIDDGESVFDRLAYPYSSGSLTELNDLDGDGLPTGAERYYDTRTDYKTFSTDGDPYGDGQEYFGINMPRISPADHPLVAAYPDLTARLESITVTPKATITSTTGGAKQEAWSITTETSDSESFEWGLAASYTATIGIEFGVLPKATASYTLSGHTTWADTHTVTNSKTNSGWTQEDWSRATTTDTVEAAHLKFTMNVKNRGTAPAEEITPHVSILLGEKPIATITSPTSINSLGMGETSGNFVVDQGIVGVGGQDIIVTLDELMAIDCGAYLDIETLQVNAKIKKWDGEKNEWVLTGTDYSAYMNEINEDSATLMLVLRDGTYKKYKVVAGSDNYNPGVTLGDAIILSTGINCAFLSAGS
uniref:Uncharacterized protein n=1 Tax=Candidatus Methanophaga sp. ANME-1 ERB7 TaxID=2759913 RepID=A0A7G9Z5X2_9EURY|nr:hypothetical protein AMFAPHJD_00031 [Methanosarcinales archaeon ANME-1 ERB7]